jgi:hypothetical protein
MGPLQLFLPIQKVDAVNRLVWGTLTEEQTDRSGEIMDYATSRPLFEKWSQDLAAVTDGKNYGNVRAMHKGIAAGQFIEPLTFDDATRSISGCAKITDDAEWKKVEERTYTGFSIGGGYAKRWLDPSKAGVIRYTAEPAETSLVDLPCCKGATFKLVKADGITEEVEFLKTYDPPVEGNPIPPLSLSPSDIDYKPDGKDPVAKSTEPADPQSELEQVWKAKDGTTFAKKADAVKHNEELATTAAVDGVVKPAQTALDKLQGLIDGVTDPADPVVKHKYSEGERTEMAKSGQALSDGSFPIKDKQDVENAVKDWGRAGAKDSVKKHIIDRARAIGAADALPDNWGEGKEKDSKPAKKVATHTMWKGIPQDKRTKELLHKDLWDIGRVACILDDLKWLRDSMLIEEALEGDTTALPDAMKAIVNDLCTFLMAMVSEEMKEIMTDTDVQLGGGDTVIVELMNAAGLMHGSMRKAFDNLGLEHVPEAFKALLIKAKAKMTEEETFHLQAAHDHVASMVGCADCDGSDDGNGSMGKMSEGHRAAVKTVHDHLASMGADCSGMAKLNLTSGRLAKALGPDDLRLDNPDLPPAIRILLAKSNGLEFNYKSMTDQLNKVIEQVQIIADQPEPGKGSRLQLHPVRKEADGLTAPTGLDTPAAIVAAYTEHLNKLSPEAKQQALMKLSLANPVLQME